MRLAGIPRAPRFPRMVRVKQRFAGPTLPDVQAAVRQALATITLSVRAGESVALAVGSRGIVNIDAVVRATVDDLKARGARPFIFPAMGSHGGGTVEGQRSVLEHYGITESAMGCPIRATMEVVQIGTALGLPVWLDAHAAEADWIGVINRVKPHTGFTGTVESGLFKMMTIGMGKHRGAVQAHRANIRHADFTTRRLADKIDWEATYINGLSACSPGGVKLPTVLDSARDAVAVALACLGRERIEDVRAVRIRNTLRLTEVEVSESFLPELATREDLTPLGAPAPLAFDVADALLPF